MTLHIPNPAKVRPRTRLPRRPTAPYYFYENHQMIESDIAIGAGLRITCTKDDLVQGLSVVGRAVSTRTARSRSCPGLARGSRRGSAPGGHRHGALAARNGDARVEGDGAIVLPGRTFVDIVRLLPGDEVTIEHSAAESVLRMGGPGARVTRSARAPRISGSWRHADVRGRSRSAARDDRAGGSRSVS